MSKDLRPAIIHLFQQSHKQPEMVTFLGVPGQTVSSAIKQFNETHGNDDRARSGRRYSHHRKNIQFFANKIYYCNDHKAIQNAIDDFPKRLRKCIADN
uniref:Transposase n=1 Tax=Ditylenchus dipsaci TaxID=166011 RepID=A0A915EJK7_9BILA